MKHLELFLEQNGTDGIIRLDMNHYNSIKFDGTHGKASMTPLAEIYESAVSGVSISFFHKEINVSLTISERCTNTHTHTHSHTQTHTHAESHTQTQTHTWFQIYSSRAKMAQREVCPFLERRWLLIASFLMMFQTLWLSLSLSLMLLLCISYRGT